MPCYKPVKAFYGKRLPSGKREIVFSSGQAQSFLNLSLPCGGCIGCRLERARQWAMRCMDEASLHRDNSFITLTFNDNNLPSNRSLDVSIFQKFMKRLRKEVAPLRLRFFIVANTVLDSVGLTITLSSSVMVFLIGNFSRLLLLRKKSTSLPSWIGAGDLVMHLLVSSHLVLRRMLLGIISRKLVLLSRMTTILFLLLGSASPLNTLR